MSETKFIHLEPGQTAVIKMADLPREPEKFLSIKDACKELKIHRTTLYRKEKANLITLDRTLTLPRVSYTELLKLKK